METPGASGTRDCTSWLPAVKPALSNTTSRVDGSDAPERLLEGCNNAQAVAQAAAAAVQSRADRQMLRRNRAVTSPKNSRNYAVSDSLRAGLPSLTRYLSEDRFTSMRSSPTRTFSPSDLCLDDGWTIHQHVSPRPDTEDMQHRFPAS